MTITYKTAMAAAQDAGNRNATKHKRKTWNAEDWRIACQTFEQLMGLP